MAKTSVVIDKPETDPLFTTKKLKVEKIESKLMWAEMLGDNLVVHWDENIHSKVNYLDEDLFLYIEEADAVKPVRAERINHLAEKQLEIQPGQDYLIRMVIQEKFHVGIATTSEYTPRLSLIPEGINRYMLAWGELEWNHIRMEVERQHNIHWDSQVDVALRITRYEAEENAPEEEWRYPGMKNLDIIGGKIKEMSLLVVTKGERRILKEIFRAYTLRGKEKQQLDTMVIKPPSLLPSFNLQREVHETDAYHLNANWEFAHDQWGEVEKVLKKKKITLSEMDIILKLFVKADDKWLEYDPGIYKKVMGKGNWFFANVPAGALYKAALVLVDRNTGNEHPVPLIYSNDLHLPAKESDVVLLPIDEGRLYVYWHLNRDEVYGIMKEKHNAEPESIRTYIKVYHDFAGGLHHHAHLDREFPLGVANSYYLSVEEDKVYRVQLIAVAEGWKTEALTFVSNPAQTGRLKTGSTPVNYVSFPQPDDHPSVRPIQSQMNTAANSIGKMIFHLHAHLPFIWERINYGTSGYWRPGGYVEEWFHEAMRETYIPLVRTFDQLIAEGVDFKISIDISPTLCSMMRNPILQEEFLNYIDSLIALAKTEIERVSREEPWYLSAAKMHLDEFRSSKSTFLKYGRDITKAFKRFQDMGKMEILTCGATHGFLPLMGSKYIEAVRGQIKTAVLDYENTFGRKPYGIWLPECAYTPGIEKVLQDFGLRYFYSETHTVLRGDSPAQFGVHAPVYIRGSQVSVFARDPETGKQVWSGDEGYPGDPDYLEFHIRGGPLKYNRITDRRGSFKHAYVPQWAEAKAAVHAQNFMENRNFRFQYIKNMFWKKPLVVATYDAELFGHHWYEGPRFLYYLFKKLHYDQNQTELTTPMHYLAEYNYNQELFPTVSSWGDKGTFDKWMYGSVAWMYRHMNDACKEMIKLARWGVEKELYNQPKDNPGVRLLSQMARELLLSQNSDAAFNISNGHFIDRMKGMYFQNLNNFWLLANMFIDYMKTGECDEILLRKIERSELIFPVIDPFVWA